MTDESAPAFLAPRAAGWFCAVFLAALAGVAVYSAADRPRSAAAETFSQTTAAGDTQYFTPPSPPLAVPEPVFTWEGRAVAPVSYDKVKIDDPRMTRVARDEASGLTLYRHGGEHFIKIAVGEYLRVAPR